MFWGVGVVGLPVLAYTHTPLLHDSSILVCSSSPSRVCSVGFTRWSVDSRASWDPHTERRSVFLAHQSGSSLSVYPRFGLLLFFHDFR